MVLSLVDLKCVILNLFQFHKKSRSIRNLGSFGGQFHVKIQHEMSPTNCKRPIPTIWLKRFVLAKDLSPCSSSTDWRGK